MGINLEKMRAKLSAIQGKGQKKSMFWKPTDGDHNIRLLPDVDEDPFKEMWLHYNVARGGLVCLKKNYGEECPICEHASRMWNEGKRTNDETLKNKARDFFAKQRFYSSIIVRGEEDQGARWWSYSKTVYNYLLELVLDADYGDITEPESGTDLVLTYGKPPGASYPQTKILPRRRSSPLMDTQEEMDSIINGATNYDEVHEHKTSQELESLLDACMSEGLDAESSSTEKTMYNNSNSSSVDDAFKELMNA